MCLSIVCDNNNIGLFMGRFLLGMSVQCANFVFPFLGKTYNQSQKKIFVYDKAFRILSEALQVLEVVIQLAMLMG